MPLLWTSASNPSRPKHKAYNILAQPLEEKKRKKKERERERGRKEKASIKMTCSQSEMWGLQHNQAVEANLGSYEVCYCVSGGGPDGKAKAQDYSTVHIRGTWKKEKRCFFYHAIVLGASSHSHGGSRLSVCGGYGAWCTGGCWCWELCCGGWFGCGDVVT